MYYSYTASDGFLFLCFFHWGSIKGRACFFCLIRKYYFQQNSWWLILILHVLYFFGGLNEVTVLYFGKDAKRQEACVSDTGFLHAFVQHFYSTISGSFQFVSEYPQVFCVDFFVSWCWHATYSFATRSQPGLALNMHPSLTLCLENVTQIFRKASFTFQMVGKKLWKKRQEPFRRSLITIPLQVWPMAIILGKGNTSFNSFPPHAHLSDGCENPLFLEAEALVGRTFSVKVAITKNGKGLSWDFVFFFPFGIFTERIDFFLSCDIGPGLLSINNWMGPNPNGPRSVSCDRAMIDTLMASQPTPPKLPPPQE